MFFFENHNDEIIHKLKLSEINGFGIINYHWIF